VAPARHHASPARSLPCTEPLMTHQQALQSPPCTPSPRRRPGRSFPRGTHHTCLPYRTIQAHIRSHSQTCSQQASRSGGGSSWLAPRRPRRTCRPGMICMLRESQTLQLRMTFDSLISRPTREGSRTRQGKTALRCFQGSKSWDRTSHTSCWTPWGRSPLSTCSQTHSATSCPKRSQRDTPSCAGHPGNSCQQGKKCRCFQETQRCQASMYSP